MTAAAVEQFKTAIERAGLVPPPLIVDDGKLHRFASNGERGDAAGYYIFHSDGVPAGVYGCWRMGFQQTWCSKPDGTMTEAERLAHRQRVDQLRREREHDEQLRQAEAGKRAAGIWDGSIPASSEHPYLKHKQVGAYGLRRQDDRLIIPLRDADGTLHSLEYIDGAGTKLFLSGGRTKGLFHLIGTPGGVLCIAEGYATAASIHEATGYAVAIACSAGNLLPVAEALRHQHPDMTLLLCGDHDESGTGQSKAKEAAEAIAGLWVIPTDAGMDWNDVHVKHGADSIRLAIESGLKKKSDTMATPATVQDPHPDDDAEPLADSLGPFPEEAWRGPFKTYRDAMQGTSEAPDTAHFTALWGVAAACLRRRVSFYYAFPHYPNVYLVNFGGTGDSKTSAGRQGLRLLPDEGVKLLRGVGSAEALGDWMQQPDEGPAVSHLLFIEELATLLTRGGWEGSTLLSFLTETFDAPDRYEIPFRKNPVLIHEPTPTLVAGTTVEWLWKGLREIDVHGGFGNRIFYMTGTPKPPIPLPAKPNAEALASVRADLQRLAAHPSMEFFFSPDAQALWNEFYIKWKSTSWAELTTAAIKRVPAYIVKLSMTYACLEGTSLIIADQLNAAIRVGHYGAKCADKLMSRHRQHTLQGKCEGRVLSALKDHDLPPWKIHHAISGSFNAEELARAIRALEAAGAISPVAKTRKGELIYRRRDRKAEV
jgi:phage/plasmid primase-like uncharacterized protein